MKKATIILIFFILTTTIATTQNINTQNQHAKLDTQTKPQYHLEIRETTTKSGEKIQPRNIRTLDTDYTPIINVTSSGRVFKEPMQLDITTQNITKPQTIATSPSPNGELYALAIYNESKKVFLYIINASTSTINQTNQKYSVNTTYCGSNTITLASGTELRHLDVLWLNTTTLVFAYAEYDPGNYYAIYTFYYKYSGPITNGSFTTPQFIFYSLDYTVNPKTNNIYGLEIFNYTANKAAILILADDYAIGSPFGYYGVLLNSTDAGVKPKIFGLVNCTGRPYAGFMSNLLYDGSKYYVAFSVSNVSTVYLWDIIMGRIILVEFDYTAITTNTPVNTYSEVETFTNVNFVPLDTMLFWVSNKAGIAFVTIAITEDGDGLVYFHDELSALGYPVNNITLDTNINYADELRITDSNPSDSAALLYWYDTQNNTVYSEEVRYSNGFTTTTITTALTNNITTYQVVDVESHALTLIRDTQIDTKIANNSALIMTLTNESNKRILINIGLGDKDYDAISDVEETIWGTQINNNDTDGDYILDGSEIYVYGTDPTNNDTDQDLASDYYEIRGVDIPDIGIRKTDPLINDTDGDGLLDGVELFGKRIDTPRVHGLVFYSDPLDNDTDNDTVSDFVELSGVTISVEYTNYSTLEYIIYSNPLKADSDNDKLSDATEYALGSDPLVEDTDLDDLSDYLETIFSTAINKADTDHDLLSDSLEIYGVNITNPHTGETYTVRPDPLDNDTDNDGFLDGEEINGFNLTIPGVYNGEIIQTDPMDKDCDRDGLSDYEEVVGFNISNKIYHTDPWNPDTDGDGLEDLNEEVYKTNPMLNDTDNDTLLDGVEVNGIYVSATGQTYYTDPTKADTDGDGIPDNVEVNGIYVSATGQTYYTDPTKADTDGDGISDYNETHGIVVGGDVYYTDPTSMDSDSDMLDDYMEIMRYGTSPVLNDTDGDGLSDGEEVYGVEIPFIGIRKTDPTSRDTDGDGLSDYEEIHGMATPIGVLYSDPTYLDTDSDGLRDDMEVSGWVVTYILLHGTNISVFVVSFPNLTDSDGDKLNDYLEYYYRSNPILNDTDRDGLLDYEEYVRDTNINMQDTDRDGLSDYAEIVGFDIEGIGHISTDPLKVDTDGDGLSDYEEIEGFNINDETVYTNPRSRDTDSDGLSDYQEVLETRTDPTKADTDNDGLRDYEEVYRFMTDPNKVDTDGDGLSDYEEIFGIKVNGTVYKTDPNKVDTDGDGLSDYEEVTGFNIEGVGLRITDPNRADTDGDLLVDKFEVGNATDPRNPDTDGDGLSDYEEVAVYGTDPKRVDTDGDGLSDYEEVEIKRSNPRSTDSDGDLFPDNIDPAPTVNNFVLVIVAVLLVVLYAAYTYGVFRNWKKDITALGVSDSGGVPMLIIPEGFQTSSDLSLVSSGFLGIHSMIGEIAGKEMKSFVLSGEVPIFISKGEYTIMWAFLKKVYPRIIKRLEALHEEMEEKFGDILKMWSGLESEVEEVRVWLSEKLSIKEREYVEE